MLGTVRGKKTIKAAKKHGFEGVDLHYMAINPMVNRAAKKNNLKTILYTINSHFVAKTINHFYPDIELTTDIPDKLLHLVKPIED